VAVRFVEASGLVDFTREVLQDLFRALVARVPEARDELTGDGRSVEAIVEEQVGQMAPVYVLAARLGRPTLREQRVALAVAESDAGRWATAAVFDGIREVYVPALVDALVATVGPPAPLPNTMIMAPDTPLDGPPPPEASVPLVESGFYVDEEAPVLIGGLGGLAALIVYPEEARRASVEGTVYVEFVVDETGAVVDPVVTHSPDASLSEEAVRVVRGARFEPGRIRGEPVANRYTLPIRFALRDDDAPGPSDDD
jgi:TonB family protein